MSTRLLRFMAKRQGKGGFGSRASTAEARQGRLFGAAETGRRRHNPIASPLLCATEERRADRRRKKNPEDREGLFNLNPPSPVDEQKHVEVRRERMPRLQDSPQVVLARSALEAAARASAATTPAAPSTGGDRAGMVRVCSGEGRATLARPDASLGGNRLRQDRTPPSPRFLLVLCWRSARVRKSVHRTAGGEGGRREV